MPKIPEYGQSKVETQVTRGARAQSYKLAGAGDFSQGLQTVAQNLQVMQRKIDDNAAEEALVNFEREKNELFFNPESGYFNSQGRDAYDNAKTMSDSLTELKKKYAEQLKSENARNAFGRAADAQITRGNADIMRHASKHIQAWEVATINSRAENSLENAQLYWNQEDQLKVQNAIGRQSVIDAAKLEGIDGKALNERLQTYDSSFARGVIGAATSMSSVTGKEALEKYGSLLEGPDKLAMESAIAKKEKAESTQKNAAQAVLIGGNLIGAYGDEVNARALINESINQIEDPELRKEVSKEATRQLELKQKADSEERVAILETGEKFLNDGGSVQQFKAQNPEAWEKLTSAQRRTLESGSPIITDFEKLSGLLLLPKNELANVNPANHAHYLAPADRTKLLNAVKAARSGGIEHQAGRTRTAETTAMVRQLFGAPPSGGYKGDKSKQVNAFHSIITDEVAYREELKGGPLSAAEYTDLLGEMSMGWVKKGFMFNSDKDITDAQYPEEVTEFLRSTGQPVNAENIIQYDFVLRDYLDKVDAKETDANVRRMGELIKFLDSKGVSPNRENLSKAWIQATQPKKPATPDETSEQ